ncbi:GUN4 domain-containing protein [Roseofilum sp. BLCC_M91]|uniref:GUN4 domain-containing protein n=1 Tax=Roseofilum halophilum BLCC-M91 TaxID=3022259 RepID=A0ABT7BQQ5_9CYAN|nr:GUN4 domain-containing protein [Roseofilum halophilum]MDJ1181533.1 GUN4 domain-containing protein [Roseofilum halophilum BLCC-M91]
MLPYIDKFPCTDLRTIDRLWVKYSKGQFGFSVQKEIYQSLGGTRELFDSEIWEKFADRVCWRKDGEWIYDTDLAFSLSIKGNLPLLSRKMWANVLIVENGFSSLASRLVDCNL